VAGRLRFEDVVVAAGRWIPVLRERGADVVVVAAHAGLGPGSTYSTDAGIPEENALLRLAEEIPGIDVIFAGHTRAAIGGRRVGGTLILHAGAHADHLAVAELVVQRTRSGIEVSGTGRVIPTSGVPPDPELVELVRGAHERTIDWLRQPIGTTPDRWSAELARLEDAPIADLVTRVQRDLTGADLSAAAVFRTDAGFGPGPITRRDILGLYSYPNTLRAVRISGDELRRYLEWSARYYRDVSAESLLNDSVPGYNFDVIEGVDYSIDLTRPAGARITRLEIAGRPVAPVDSFTIALNNYRQSGGGGFDMIVDAPVVYLDEVDIASRIIEFVRRRDTLRVADVHVENWRIEPRSAVERLRAEAKGNGG
jgi:2',3'-cyclic-nucleotide 2'-phosphodiesterase/3'-nucleotidase